MNSSFISCYQQNAVEQYQYHYHSSANVRILGVLILITERSFSSVLSGMYTLLYLAVLIFGVPLAIDYSARLKTMDPLLTE